MNRYLVTPDPAADEPEQSGTTGLTTTQCPEGIAVLINSQLMGRVAVRESIVLRVNYYGEYFTSNLITFLCEERLNLASSAPAPSCAQRPASVVMSSQMYGRPSFRLANWKPPVEGSSSRQGRPVSASA